MKTQIIILLIASVFLVNCQQAKSDSQIFTLNGINGDANEQSITAEVGKVIIIKIRANPTTGYQVFLANGLSDLESRGVVKALNVNQDGGCDEYKQDKRKAPMVGVPGYYYFKFSSKNVGEVPLIFESKRVWDPSDATALKINLTVVKGSKN